MRSRIGLLEGLFSKHVENFSTNSESKLIRLYNIIKRGMI
jgi:hypothetical protein